jgi:uncharacterized protein YsxB (DUF464 family)
MIEVSGHANDKKHPRCVNTIRACEVITSLTQTLIQSIKKIAHEKPIYKLDYGAFSIATTGLSDTAQILIDSFMVGVNLAQTAYTDYITVSDETRRGCLNKKATE